MEIRLVTPMDFGEIFTLQRAAFVDEARVYETPFVPALDETLPELTLRMAASTSWVAQADRRIVGAISLRDYRDGGPDIERVMVAPDLRGTGISSLLFATAEDHARSLGHGEVQLIVGDLATTNRAIYTHLGWIEQSSHCLDDFEHVMLHTMSKPL